MARTPNFKFASPARQRGVEALELALILPVLLVMLSGVIEYGRALWYYDALAKGARDAARYLSTRQIVELSTETSDASIARAIVADTAGRAGISGFDPVNHMTVLCAPTPCTNAATAASVSTVSVQLNYPFVVGGWLPLFGPAPGEASTFTATLAPHVTMRYMR